MTLRATAIVCAAMMLACAAAGCASLAYRVRGVVPSHLETHAVRSIKEVKVNRIAVMPIIANPGPNGDTVADGGPEAVTAELYTQVASAGGWDVVPQDDVAHAMQKLPPSTPKNLDENALALARELSVDAVLYGTLERYKEREGLDYAAAAPASVTFSLEFVDLRSKQVIWHAKFAKSQKALSQNAFDLVNFVQHKARWVRANEIAADGVELAVDNLHSQLNLTGNVKRFETGTYGQLKSGQQRYTTGPQGIY